MTGCVALVVGAGQGVRFGGDVPKQYLPLLGQAVMRRSLMAFLGHPRVDAVRPVINPAHRELFEESCAGLDTLSFIPGGATRQESVRLGLESLVELKPKTVLIHDAARPLVDTDLISRVLDALEKTPGAIPALAVTDTLKRAGEAGRIEETVPRAGLWRAQTPQGFRFEDILAAHRHLAKSEATDDAQLAEMAGLAVAVVEGSEDNMKLTTSDDWLRAEQKLFGGLEPRTGSGFDVHRFGPGDHVTLCGVKIPHEAGLEGHSDADVAMHALTDAILGALGEGDIGHHFPPTEAKWRGAPSDIFLKHAGDLAAARGGRIVHADVTIICERPKVGPHRMAMVDRLAAILGLDRGRISVKATTTEGLGFTGRREGIAAQAVATVLLPPQ
ncbi:MAG: bifunctional 2-C-methyl-D-erythritol 4-phosphate cytidylyltransferase/2-C-methyl-D-erythritol 2,4-cyclodiphosphate synthase [Alphaproteobacteria bacterium]|nr:bifunctional 2-C-methyl-D-erythritol 4-phosphate cytidylyltransferase/2-C-methyl-D-erythritol 2,4-cyclodiphosphate synthase [Alphaproteobacteria bacterium]